MATVLTNFLAIYLVIIVMDIAFRILIAFSINADCKARDLKSTTAFSVLAFFFPVIVGIVYAFARNSAQKNNHPKLCTNCNMTVNEAEFACPKCGNTNLSVWADPNAPKLKKKSINLFIIAIVIYVVAIIFTTVFTVKVMIDVAENPQEFEDSIYGLIDEFEQYEALGDYDDNIVFYDKLGNQYDDWDDVVYYDKDGNKYILAVDDDSYLGFFVNIETKEKYPSENCFVDEEGNFVYFENPDALTMNDDYISYTDAEGKIYYDASNAVWDADGNLS